MSAAALHGSRMRAVSPCHITAHRPPGWESLVARAAHCLSLARASPQSAAIPAVAPRRTAVPMSELSSPLAHKSVKLLLPCRPKCRRCSALNARSLSPLIHPRIHRARSRVDSVTARAFSNARSKVSKAIQRSFRHFTFCLYHFFLGVTQCLD